MTRPTPKFPYIPGRGISLRQENHDMYPMDKFGNCTECGGGPEGSIAHMPNCPHKRHTGMAATAILQKGRVDQIIRGTGRVNAVGSGQNTTGDRAKWRVTEVPKTEVTEE